MARTSCIQWDDFCFVLDHLNTLSWKFIVLDMSIFSLSLLVLHAYGRSIKYKFLFLKSLVWHDQGLNVPSTALETTTLSISPPVRFSFCGNIFWLLFFIFHFQSPHKYIIWFFICHVIYYSVMTMTEIFHCSARWVAFD